jgi:hypothetical protein
MNWIKRLILVVPAVLPMLQCGGGAAHAQTLTAADFACFLTKYAENDPYANCDGVGGLTANDFACFRHRYVTGDLWADCDGSGKVTGWTNLNPPAGAIVRYVAPNGSGTACTQSNPCSLATAMATTGNGPNQILFPAGSTWTNVSIDVKESGSPNSYFVFGSYGFGARPKFLSSETIFHFDAGKVGIAIVGLHLEYTGSGQNVSSMFGRDGTAHVLIEDCYIAKWGDGIVFHSTGGGRLSDIRINRNVIVDIKDTDGRCQGMFFGEVDNLVITGNVLDFNGRSAGEQTIFMHNVYIHETCGPAVFKGNISTRATSHGVQVRPGGIVTDNLFAENAVNCYIGDAAGVTNELSRNVVIGGRDISPEHPRGIAYEIGGRGPVTDNIAAHQKLGTQNVTAFGFAGFDTGTVSGNVVEDWDAPGGECWATAVEWNGGAGGPGSIVFERNRLTMPNGPGMMSRHESRPWSSQFTYRLNRYFTTTPFGQGCNGYAQFSTSSGVGLDWNSWNNRETGSTFAAMPAVDISFEARMASLQMPGGLAEFMAQCRTQSKQYWRPEFTAEGFRAWAWPRANP